MIKEIDTALKDDSPIIPTFNVYLPSEATSLIDCNEQLEILCNHYGKDITDTYQSKSTLASKLIDPIAQKIESEEFFSKFEDVYMCLLNRVKSDAKKELQLGELNQESMYKRINENKTSSGNVYSNICSSGSLIRFPENMKLFKFSILILTSTSGVECGFSAMNLIVTPRQTNVNQVNTNRFMRISINGSEHFTNTQMEQLLDKYKNDGKCHISL